MATTRERGQLSDEDKRSRDDIEKKYGKTPEQLYQERVKRVKDAIELREPDRVPVVMSRTSVFAARYAGLPASVMYYDHPAYRRACKKVILDFEPDICSTAMAGDSGPMLELLDAKHLRWPGGNLPDDVSNQAVELENMKVEEYVLFFSDPSDFIMRYYLPRVYGVLAPLAKLPPFRTLIGGGGFTSILSLLNRPEFQELAKKLNQAAREREKERQEAAGFAEEMAALGFPAQEGGRSAGGAPFDTISDSLRGMAGAMTDMYRCPDKLLAACDKILEWRIAQATPADNTKGVTPKITGAPLHRGAEGFMSRKQFETFYWSGLKKAMQVSIDLGYVYRPMCEGNWNDRIEYLLELPKAKVIASLYETDMARAKEVLGSHTCIAANVPGRFLQICSPQEVEDHCKNLIKACGKGGGFILSIGSAINEAKPANVKAMVDTIKKYGRY